MAIRAVYFDIGETLLDETRIWALHAHMAGVPAFTFMAAMGAAIQSGKGYEYVFETLGRPLPADIPAIEIGDLYADAVPTLRSLRSAGFYVGVAGNQPQGVEEILGSVFGADIPIISSDRLGVSKPDPAFFSHIAALANVRPSEIAYVGDRIDNDIVPAAVAGMMAIHVMRGPWAYIHANSPAASRAHHRVASLADIAPLL